MTAVAASRGAAYICAHTGGHPPRTDPHRVRYHDVVGQAVDDLLGQVEAALAAGVREDGLLIDAAQDFGKNTYHSLALTGQVSALVDTGWPVLLAISNKKFIAETLGLQRQEVRPGHRHARGDGGRGVGGRAAGAGPRRRRDPAGAGHGGRTAQRRPGAGPAGAGLSS